MSSKKVPTASLSKRPRIVFTQGGKGGVGKTDLSLSLVSWYRQNGVAPILFDFDIENTNKSGLQNFYPDARKHDVHRDGALDEVFEVCDQDAVEIVLADLGSGAGNAAYQWFDSAYDDAMELGIRFTAIGVTTNEAGSVQSLLKWADHLQDKVDYLIVLSAMGDAQGGFEYWHSEPAVTEFVDTFHPVIMPMDARVPEFQSELRNQVCTLQDVIDGKVASPFLRRMKNRMRAKRYQRILFEGFDCASAILLP
ncbi:MAG: hypothetical protein O3C21_05760 [Verrucomicrobia bacterium]|nr:hypothetical protein [Verrucomicrobiota bacterium]